jgi:hypothetical protein
MAESSAIVTSIRVVFLPLNIKKPPFFMEEVDRWYIRHAAWKPRACDCVSGCDNGIAEPGAPSPGGNLPSAGT